MLSADLRYLVNQFGQELTLGVKSFGSYDVSTGTVTGTTEATYTVKGYFYDYRLGEIDGTNILYGDRRLVLTLLDTSGNTIPEPEVNDEVSGQGDKVSIVRCSKIMSGESPVCYLCQVRE